MRALVGAGHTVTALTRHPENRPMLEALGAKIAVADAPTSIFWLLVPAGTVGVITPSGNEVGPFLPIEQAALSHIVADR